MSLIPTSLLEAMWMPLPDRGKAVSQGQEENKCTKINISRYYLLPDTVKKMVLTLSCLHKWET